MKLETQYLVILVGFPLGYTAVVAAAVAAICWWC